MFWRYSKIQPIVIAPKISLAVLLERIKEKRENFILTSDFFSLALALIKEVAILHSSTNAFPLSLKGLMVAYNKATKTYELLEVIKIENERLMSNLRVNDIDIYKDEYQLSRTLEILLPMTTISNSDSRKIYDCVANELQAFLVRSDHYTGKETRESLELLMNTFNHLHKQLTDSSSKTASAVNTKRVMPFSF